MSLLLNKITEKTTETLTENGAKTFSTSLNANVDLFFEGGALRFQSEDRVLDLFIKAYLENEDLAMANLYHLRDIRNGKGERLAPRIMFGWLAENHPEKINLDKMAEYGYYKDIIYLLDTKLKDDVILFIKKQLEKDKDSKTPSLLAKWLPTWSTKDRKLKKFADIIVRELFSCSKQYRKTLKFLREKLNIVETKITLGKFSEIDYSKIPSKSLNKYKKCFMGKDGERFTEFLNKVKKGEAKINTSTLYPYDIVRQYAVSHDWVSDGYNVKAPENAEYLETAWNNLNNVFAEKSNNALVVADTSGSMTGQPMMVCLSLAVYIAERNKGLFHNSFIKFSSDPVVSTLKGKTLADKLQSVACDGYVGSTNLQGVFDVILDTAKKNNIPEEEMPTSLIIISDMEFDSACDEADLTNFEMAKRKYQESGYKMPTVVFWNVNSYKNNVPVRYNEQGVALVSGYSTNTLKSIVENDIKTPLDTMLQTLKPYLESR